MNEKETNNIYIDYFSKYEGCYACVMAGNKKGVINLAGNIILPIQYDNIFLPETQDGWFVVNHKKKHGYIDKNNQIMIPLIYDFANPFTKEGLAAVSKGGKCGFIDKSNNVVIPFKYRFADSFRQGLACVQNEDLKMGFIDAKENEIVPFRYSYADGFVNGLAMVEIDHSGSALCGMINLKGDIVIPCQYEDLFFISDTIIKGYLPKGHINYFVIQERTIKRIDYFSEYDDIDSFVNGYASVSKNGEYGLINEQGALTIPYKYNSTLVLEKGSDLVTTSKGSTSFGAFSLKTGQEVIPFVYPYVANLGQNRYVVENHTRRSRKLVDENNHTIFESKKKLFTKYTPIYILIIAAAAYWFFFT